MKKKIVIIIIAIVIICLVGFGIFFVADGRLRLYQMNKERINNCTSLSKYVEYHDMAHTGDTIGNVYMYFDAQNIKCDLLNEKNILYYDKECLDIDIGLLILDDYTLYETAFNSKKLYSNEQQYKKIETDIKISKIKVIFNRPYFISTDNKYYKIENKELKELNTNYMSDYEYAKITTLLKDNSIKRVISHTIDNIVVINDDGQVYSQEYKFDNLKNTYTLINKTLLLSNKDYGHILDISYSYYNNKQEISKIVCDKGVFYLKQTNDQQYIDTEPTYEIVTSDIYNKYKSDVKFIDSNYVFTTDNNIIRTDMLCRDIDKEVK